jgi:hypothetical protein
VLASSAFLSLVYLPCLFALKGQNWLLSCLLSLAIACLPLWGKRASKQLRRDRCLLIYVTKGEKASIRQPLVI